MRGAHFQLAACSAVVLLAIAAAGCSENTSTSSTSQTPIPDSTPPANAVVNESDHAVEEPETALLIDSRTVGFRDEEDLFEALPGDTVEIEERAGKKAMRWDIEYVANQHRACVRDVKIGIASGMTLMRFDVRSDSNQDLWVQVNEENGEGFYQIISVGAQWKSVTIKLADLKLNDDKAENRQLDVDKIAQVLVVDAAALGGKTGQRTVWFADWEFAGSVGFQPPTESTSRSETPRLEAAAPAFALTSPQLRAKVDLVLPKEGEERWLRIGWQPNLMRARQESQRVGKPMLIWIMDGNVLGCT
jgi:hypothetical protein